MGFSNVYGIPGPKRQRAALLDGAALAADLRAEVAAEVEGLLTTGLPRPTLATVLVGSDPASEVYVAAKHRACAAVGIHSIDRRLDAGCSPGQLFEQLVALNEDPAVHGILLQLPLPGELSGAAFVEAIDPLKDVDGLSTPSVGNLWRGRTGLRPATPAGVMALLRRGGVELRGAEVVIVGRSELVGKPLAAMLLDADATVSVCHRHSRDLAGRCAGADVLVAACGQPHLIGREHVKPGAVVIDVGITRGADGLVGDVDFEAVLSRAGAITPVPGGVGPMTIAMLLSNTVRAAELQRHRH